MGFKTRTGNDFRGVHAERPSAALATWWAATRLNKQSEVATCERAPSAYRAAIAISQFRKSRRAFECKTLSSLIDHYAPIIKVCAFATNAPRQDY
ncbi:MAG: hypothetical protein DMG43_08630 [Acidobacteria bacterium]|nr:MAG: hypothetical protein DMG43_08630 [Acidobacteriota bacterium]